MLAIFKRELSSYFLSPIAYVAMAIFYLFSGIFFYMICLQYDTSDLSGVFSQMFIVVLMITPIITMRSFSEERRQRTDQALFTAPVSLLQIVMGKFLSAFVVYACCVAIFLVYALVIQFFFVTPDWAVILGTMFGILLLGAALIAIDIFLSSLTESQVVAALLGFGVALAISLIDVATSYFTSEFMQRLVSGISFNQNYVNFTRGIIDLIDTVFFISIIVVFIELTVAMLDVKRTR
ncbi:MAG: ABC transporter permease subunit [Eubacteriales bacterium]|nr:ABC transporter permease subunit [Eubacteriales bacterium]